MARSTCKELAAACHMLCTGSVIVLTSDGFVRLCTARNEAEVSTVLSYCDWCYMLYLHSSIKYHTSTAHQRRDAAHNYEHILTQLRDRRTCQHELVLYRMCEAQRAAHRMLHTAHQRVLTSDIPVCESLHILLQRTTIADCLYRNAVYICSAGFSNQYHDCTLTIESVLTCSGCPVASTHQLTN
jgi:hypothetical protein